MEWYLKVLKQYVDFETRARRKEYWMFALVNGIIGAITLIIDYFIGMKIPIVTYVYQLAVLIPSIALCVRRLHDIGKSGWFYLITLIPIVGPIFFLVWACKEGQPEANQWGANPKF